MSAPHTTQSGMDAIVAYGRAVLCRALGATVPECTVGQASGTWTRAVAAACDLPDPWFEVAGGTIGGDDALVSDAMAAAVARAATLDTATARELLPEYVEQMSARKTTGTFYTARDVCDWIAARVIDAAVADLVAASSEHTYHGAAHASEPTDGSHVFSARERHALLSQRIADPACGSGAFLVSVATHLSTRLVAAGLRREDAAAAALAATYGFDVSVAAVEAARAMLLTWAHEWGVSHPIAAALIVPRIVHADTSQAEWYAPGEYTCIVGNPPFVVERVASAPEGLGTAQVPNRSAWITERALDALQPGGHAALVLPLSTVCSPAFEAARNQWEQACGTVWVRSFDCIPATLFPGVVQRVVIMHGQRRLQTNDEHTSCMWMTDGYNRWSRAQRAELFDEPTFVASTRVHAGGAVARIGSKLEQELLARIHQFPPAERVLPPRTSAGHGFWYKRRWSYHLLLLDHVPELRDAVGATRVPSEFKWCGVSAQVDAHAVLAIYASSLFWWYFNAFGDSRNLNRRDITQFPLPDITTDMEAKLADGAHQLMHQLRATAEQRMCTYQSVGSITNTYYRHRFASSELAQIDDMVAELYGLDAHRAQFIREFEGRYRWGAGLPVQAGAENIHAN